MGIVLADLESDPVVAAAVVVAVAHALDTPWMSSKEKLGRQIMKKKRRVVKEDSNNNADEAAARHSNIDLLHSRRDRP